GPSSTSAFRNASGLDRRPERMSRPGGFRHRTTGGADMGGAYWRRYARLPWNVYAIGLISLLNDASSEIIYPFLPLYLGLVLGASPIAIGLIEGAAESVSSVLKLFSGYISDRSGRRKPLVVGGYFLASCARSMLALATNWPQALGLRMTDRVGKG